MLVSKKDILGLFWISLSSVDRGSPMKAVISAVFRAAKMPAL
jgi:hypothetical protein